MPRQSAAIAVIAGALFLSAAGCTSRGIAPTTPDFIGLTSSAARTAGSPAQGDARGGVLYVSDYTNREIFEFPADQHVPNPPPIARIKTANVPRGLWVDHHGILYVVNTGPPDQSSVQEYKPGANRPFRTITRGLSTPEGVAVDASGKVYVSDVDPIKASVAMIVEYPAGSISPSKRLFATVRDAGIAYPGAMTFDAKGNLYAAMSFENIYPPRVFRFAPGGTTGHDLRLEGLDGELGIGSDEHDNLYVTGGNGSALGINVYRLGTRKPARTIKFDVIFPSLFAVTRAGALYVPDANGNPSGSTLLEYAPGGSSPVNRIAGSYFNEPFGAALRAEAF